MAGQIARPLVGSLLYVYVTRFCFRRRKLGATRVSPHRHARDVAVRRLPLSAAGAKVRGIESREEGLRALQDAGALVMMMGVCVPREDLDHRSRGRARG